MGRSDQPRENPADSMLRDQTRLANAVVNLASVEASRMSHSMAMMKPRPAQGPLMAQMIGFRTAIK